MDLKEIASISGKSGLYKVLKPTRNGVIVETLDEKKIKTVAGATSRVSVLKEVSIYTNNEEGSIPLKDVLQKMFETLKGEIEITNKSTNNELFAFLEKLVPDFDREKVYPSDVKKLVNWYQILLKFSPETLENLGKEEEPKEVVEAKEEKPKKTTEKTTKVAEVKEEKPKKTTEKATKVVEAKEEKPKKTAEKAKKEVADVKDEKPKKTTEKAKKEVAEIKEEKPTKTAVKAKKEVAEVKEEKSKKTTEKAKNEVVEAKEEKPKKNTKKKD